MRLVVPRYLTSALKDSGVKRKVLARLSRIEGGNFGDFKSISQDVSELWFFFGVGLRIYYTIQQGKAG